MTARHGPADASRETASRIRGSTKADYSAPASKGHAKVMSKTENLAQPCYIPPRRFFGRWGRSKLLTIAALAIVMLAALAPPALRSAMAQNDESLFTKIERVIKVKEPRWKLVTKDERKGAVNKYFTQDWGLGGEYVSTTTYEMIDSEEAARVLAEFIQSPVSVPVRRAKVAGLGDEAYTIGDGMYSKKGSGTLVVRRGRIMIRLDASSLVTAQRFAKHMVGEVDSM